MFIFVLMAIRRLKIKTGIIEEDGIKLPIYKTIDVPTEFYKLYDISEELIAKLTKPELLLALYLFKTASESGIVYNNKVTKREFQNFCKEKNNLNYKTTTIDQAFSTLRREGVIVSNDIVKGAYWINTAFIHIGHRNNRDRILIDIDRQEFDNRMKQQKLERIMNE